MAGKGKRSVNEKLLAGELTAEQAYELTREAAVSSLDRAMQCQHGLEQKLLKRGYPPDAVVAVLDRLIEVGLVNDSEYANALVRARLERGLARRAIGAELSRKGVEARAIANALEQVDLDQQMAAAEAIAARVVNRCAGLATEVVARRAFGAVSRRGFAAGTAANAVQKAMAHRPVVQGFGYPDG